MSHQINQKKQNAYSDELVFTVVIFSKLVNATGMFLLSPIEMESLPRGLDVANPCVSKLQALSPLQSKSSIDVTEDDFPIPPSPDEPVDRLLGLMTTISALLNANNTPNGCNLNVSYYQELLDDCLLHKERLMAWYAREINSIGGRPSIYPPNESVHTSLPSAEHIFGASYRFPSLDNARITLLFWASLSILHGLIAQVRLRAYEQIPNDAIADEDLVLTEFYADEISRSLPYCLQTSMRAWGVSVAIFGLSQICKVYMEFRRREKFTWSQHAFYIMGDLGFDFAFRLSEMLWQYWSLGEKTDSSMSLDASFTSVASTVEESESPTGAIEKKKPRQIRFTDD
ncbi:hypothetical protein N7478_008954 [Penicillium angulare]|uniref:uncharacterized protein n=1 Tax=Penicillium angulare TaxID=116970 RepID=UPI002540891C|nr:uncharacterized protein N7478_008954 [Penicillium angulare]KAJ5273829.1 hypothetical protein N7478_008954 [Penicillium angulare]